MVTVEALNAEHGDCLLLHYALDGVPQLWLIDGGPRRTWNGTLKKRLNQLAAGRDLDLVTGERRLPIRLGVVTHIDSDHIAAMSQMVAALLADPPLSDTPPVVFDDFWFNGFRQLLADDADGHVAQITTGLAGLASGGAFLVSVTEGVTLQTDLARLKDRNGKNLVLNRQFADKVQTPFAKEVAGVEVALLGPTQAQLDELRKAWAKDRHVSPAELAATERRDDSPTNRSSIAFLASVDGKTILFTGDALAEDLIAGWNTLENPPEAIDVMKVPHHGAAGNNSRKLFELIPARHYILCANGKDGNPDLATLDMLFQARPDGDYSIHLTTPESNPGIAGQVTVLNKKAKGRVIYRGEDALSVSIEP
ncbi:hypothetical protein [Paracoccus sp. SSK6]|uniref:hypothetical protein n=1 Tax=Paracoccus sp. SSK6 TaxID=3143131 RepID=UPI003219B5C5